MISIVSVAFMPLCDPGETVVKDDGGCKCICHCSIVCCRVSTVAGGAAQGVQDGPALGGALLQAPEQLITDPITGAYSA